MTPSSLATTSRHARRVMRPACSRRTLHTSTLVSRDVMAKYRRPPGMETGRSKHPQANELPMEATKPAAPIVREKEVIVEGVPIPPRPIPPGDKDCCMSGCVHCVLTIYTDDLDDYNSALAQAEAKLKASGLPAAQWPSVMREGQQAAGDDSENFGTGGDPSVAAFMALEAKLKAKNTPRPELAGEQSKLDRTVSTFTALEERLRKRK